LVSVFFEHVLKMRSHGVVGNAEDSRHLGDAADIDDGKQHADLGGRQVKLLRDGLRHGRQIERGLADEHHRDRRVGDAGLAPCARGQRQHIGHITLAVPRFQRQGHAPAAEREIADRRGRPMASPSGR
jgi:hypothetical protein